MRKRIAESLDWSHKLNLRFSAIRMNLRHGHKGYRETPASQSEMME
jgi:hypothetical protein